MRILGSGTPRLKRDFGYGYDRTLSVSLSVHSLFSKCGALPDALPPLAGVVRGAAYLVLAVAVTSRRTAGHCDGFGEVVGGCEGVGV